jgi:NAD(P)H-hydrate epimerase
LNINSIYDPSSNEFNTGATSLHTIRAQHTLTFVAPKVGFDAVGAKSITGEVHVLDIGAPRKLIHEVMRR